VANHLPPGHDPLALSQEAADELGRRTGLPRHDVAVVLGSGWSGVGAALGPARAELPVTELPGFPVPAVPGHEGKVRSLMLGGKGVVVMIGRIHAYEGHPPASIVHGVRMAVLAGCTTVILTNAAGALRPGLAVGQPVLIRDHLNLTGRSPLTGLPHRDGIPSPFVDLTDLYSSRLRQQAHAATSPLPEGVYAGLLGPSYETPAEIAMLRTLGADLVGMSTVLEAIAARHLGAEVMGLSLVTNAAAGLGGPALDHAEVLAAGQASAPALGDLIGRVLAYL
jgi:purine-nucleoside phosphorylase